MSNTYFKYDSPPWKDGITYLSNNFGYISRREEMKREHTYGDYETGLKNEKSGAGISVRDDGCIDIFSSPTTGVRLDPKSQSITFITETITSVSKTFNLRTKPDGFRWNGYPINPQLYSKTELNPTAMTKDFQLAGREQYYNKKKKKWEWREVYIPPVGKKVTANEFSDEVINMMKDMGIPI